MKAWALNWWVMSEKWPGKFGKWIDIAVMQLLLQERGSRGTKRDAISVLGTMGNAVKTAGLLGGLAGLMMLVGQLSGRQLAD